MFFIGICGCSGSGKSLISKYLKKYFEEEYNLNSLIISLDMYYKSFNEYCNEDKKEFINCKQNSKAFNFDKPRLIKMNKVWELIKNIKIEGKEEIIIPTYYFGKKETTYSQKLIKNIDIIIIEGIFLFHEIKKSNYNNFFDYLIYILVEDKLNNKKYNKNSMYYYFSNFKNDEIRLFLRRYKRDTGGRKNNITMIKFLENWEEVMNSFNKYIKPNIYLADEMINNNEEIKNNKINNNILSIFKKIYNKYSNSNNEINI